MSESAQENVLTVNDLSISFRTRNGSSKAVDNVNFEIARGETLALVGESGSGKSVTCYSLLGLIPQPPGVIESGSAQFKSAGRKRDLLSSDTATLRSLLGDKIALIFQDPMTCLNPYLTVGEQLIEPLCQHTSNSRSQARLRAIELLKEVGIIDAEMRFGCYPHEFSGGMRQRVMIAMALITEPELLIADEPTTALDVTIQAQILELLDNLKKQRNIALIFISHDLSVVANIADRVAVMRAGKIVETGETQQIFKQAQHPYTQQLLASVPSGPKPAQSFQRGSQEQPLLKVEHLRSVFEQGKPGLFAPRPAPTIAVNDVSFELRHHEILGLVGESGSGKSTLGRSVIQLIKPTGGSVQLDGQELTQLKPKQLKPLRQRMQMIFQDPYASLNPRMTVFDTLAEPLLYHRIATRKNVITQVLELMDDVGLAHGDIRKYPHEFSGGQRQRIAIGRAIATKPQLIIADEPVSALDVTIQAQILDLILALVERHNSTMLFISHDLSVVRYIADRVLVMHKGKLIESGETESLWANPRESYTRELFAAVPQAINDQDTTKTAR